MEIMRETEASQWLPREEILLLQWSKLRRLMEDAYQTVPYYRRSFDQAGISPKEIKNRDDFAELPMLSKDDIRDNPRSIISTGINKRLRVFRTGGSTGEPFPFWKDPHALAAGLADIRCTRLWRGIGLDDRVVRFWGHEASLGSGLRGRLAHLVHPLKQVLMNRLEFSAYDMSPASMERYWKRIDKFRPKMILGYASSLYVFARFLRERNIDARETGIRVVVSTSEVLYDWQRKLIEEVFGCRIAIRYGATEVGELAFECRFGVLHTLDEHIYLELVRTEAVQHLPEEYGEVVVTCLENYGAPLIRYRLNDIACRRDAPCSCGLGLGMIDELHGRSHDLIKTPDGRYVHGQMFTHIFDQTEGIKKFQVIQETLEDFVITISVERGFGDKQECFLTKRLVEQLGEQVKIDIRYVDDIPLEGSGKFRWIKSRIH